MARMAKGYKGTLVLDFEDEFGVENDVPAGKLMPYNTWSVRPSRNQSQPGTITGSRNPVEPIDENIQVNGQAVVPLDALSFPLWLKALFGPPVTTGAGPTYTHVFKVGDTQPPFLAETKIATDTPFYARGKGHMIGKMSLTAEPAGEQTVNLDIVGSEVTYEAAPYDDDPAPVQFARLARKDVTLKEGGTVLAKKATTFSFDIDAGLDTDGYTLGGGGILGDIAEGLMSASGNITVLLKDRALLDKALNSTETSLEIAFAFGGNSITFVFNEVKFSLTGPVLDGPKGVRLEAGWSAYHNDHGGNSAVVVTVVNTIPSYA